MYQVGYDTFYECGGDGESDGVSLTRTVDTDYLTV
jgi:hypothetical protein